MPALVAWRAAVGTALLVATVAAAAVQCGALRLSPPPAASRSTSAAEAALSPERRCFGPGARKAVLAAPDGARLAAALLGGGPRGLVLIHDADSTMCQWVRFAREWAAGGYRVLALDLRCHGFSECRVGQDYADDVAAAVDALRRAGAGRVVLVGGALGGTAAIVAGARLGEQVAGVVALSAGNSSTVVAAGPGPRTVVEAAPLFRVPLLMVSTAQDGAALTPAEATAFLRTAPSTDKARVVRPGTTHGCDLLRTGGDIADLVDRFIARHTA